MLILTRLETMKISDIMEFVKAGWNLLKTRRGSHHKREQPTKIVKVTTAFNMNIQVKVEKVTKAGHPNDDVAPGTLNSIFKQADLKGEG